MKKGWVVGEIDQGKGKNNQQSYMAIVQKELL